MKVTSQVSLQGFFKVSLHASRWLTQVCSIYKGIKGEEPECSKNPRLQFHLLKAREDAHCLVHCFAKRFNEVTKLVLEKLWHEMNQNIELYIRLGVYEAPEDLRIELAKYTFSKNYSNDTADQIIEALAKVYEARVFIYVDKIQQRPENNVGVDFPNIIHLIKTGQHYGLLKQTIDVDDLPFYDEEKEESGCDCPKR